MGYIAHNLASSRLPSTPPASLYKLLFSPASQNQFLPLWSLSSESKSINTDQRSSKTTRPRFMPHSTVRLFLSRILGKGELHPKRALLQNPFNPKTKTIENRKAVKPLCFHICHTSQLSNLDDCSLTFLYEFHKCGTFEGITANAGARSVLESAKVAAKLKSARFQLKATQHIKQHLRSCEQQAQKHVWDS